MAYLKPQTPLKDLNSGDYFYPLTTIDQVQKSDGSRVQDYDLGNVALEDSDTPLKNLKTGDYFYPLTNLD